MRTIAGLVLGALAFAGLLGQPALARERVHYIAADEVLWNYAPQGRNLMTGGPLPKLYSSQLGWTYWKAVYREYTDASFSTLAPVQPADRYRGLVGPSIHAEVGDTVVVVFKNRTRLPMDIAPGGVASKPAAAAVSPGATRTYRWPITAADGPGPNDDSSVLYAYESDVHQTSDELAGLIGPLIVTRHGAARADGSPADVDQEVVLLYSAQLESHSPFFARSLADQATNPRHIRVNSATPDLDNAMHSINGFMFGNMPVPVVREGQRVRWYMLSTSDNFDGHAPTWEGQTILLQGNRADVISLAGPHMIADMVPDNPGVWELTCSLDVHIAAGMVERFKVLPR